MTVSRRSHDGLIGRHSPCTIRLELCNVQQRELLTEQRPQHQKKQLLSHSKSWTQRNSHAPVSNLLKLVSEGPTYGVKVAKRLDTKASANKAGIFGVPVSTSAKDFIWARKTAKIDWGSHQHNQKWLEQSRYMCHLSKLLRVPHRKEGFCQHETIDITDLQICVYILQYYIYIYMYKQKHIHIYIYKNKYTGIFTYIHIYTYMYIYICIYTYIYIFKHIYTYLFIFIHIFTSSYIFIHIHTYLYIYIYIHIHI